MTLQELIKQGITKPNITIYKIGSYEFDSPVPCSSDIRVYPDSPNIISKKKKPGKQPQNPAKMLWEYFQYEALHRVFENYSLENLMLNVKIAEPFAVYPKEYHLFTEFISGFILQDFGNQVKEPFTVKWEDMNVRAEYSISFFLGCLSIIKEIEGIYHSDFDLRHVIFDANNPGISMIDLENTRYIANKEFVAAESEFIKKLWFDFCISRGSDQREINNYYQLGRYSIKKPEACMPYPQMLKQVGKEYGVSIRPEIGFIDKTKIGLQKLKKR